MHNLHKTIAIVATATVLVAIGGSFAAADLVNITYFDRGKVNPESNGGPRWEGVVDTVTNRLRIDTWFERPGHGIDFWVPGKLSAAPMVWQALDDKGSPYDVPQSFGTTAVPGSPTTMTATIGSDFGFFSALTLAEMPWNEGAFAGPSGPSLIPGWGGLAQRDASTGDFVYYTDRDPSSGAVLDETILLYLPVSAADPNISLDATIMVTSRTVTSAPMVINVPEPSAFLGVGLTGTLCAASNWLRKRRGSRGTPATALPLSDWQRADRADRRSGSSSSC